MFSLFFIRHWLRNIRMESPRKFNDCYFYYYSTCTKGDNCVFRHEPSALGCETMCPAWQQGKCTDKHCKLRHMELRKNRKQIPCYWENQPGGCRKKHCPFMHKNPDARTDGIAPSQPGPPIATSPATSSIPEASAEQALTGVPTPNVPPPASVPLLWQQRQVLDSAILGVLPASTDLLGGRRVVTHAHAHAHAHPHPHGVAHGPHEPTYAPLPVDPLVVNFEEESDNESAPSSTPTKAEVVPDNHDDPSKIARTKSQELLLLEKIQAEAAAFYNYDALPLADAAKDRKIVRTNLATKYDRLTLDEIAGKQPVTERRNSLDFKVLSLDEIRARKKVSETIIHSTPITLNLNRKRKLSTQETITTAGNKIIKVVRSNSIVYKKVDKNAPAQPSQAKMDVKKTEEVSRKRTLSEHSDIYEMQEDELVDNCYEFKRIKIGEHTSKPRLIRSRSANKSISESNVDDTKDQDSDTDVQFVSLDISDDKTCDSDVIDVETANMGEPVDVVDLCDDQEDTEITVADLELDFVKNVPDVVASCHKNINDKDIINDIDSILNEEL
ncbi:unnamed protein product [Leptosia nina]|uniref:C3H1-type domain-containing protein n=1 Tax=Leptosia nina TaxID=320188 RepID=A0AAV1IZA0_9NEOP